MTRPQETYHATTSAQAGAVHRRQLHRLGYTRKMIRGEIAKRALEPVGTDLFVISGVEGGWRQQAWCALLESGPDTVLSHRSAAALHEIGGFTMDRLDVLEVENKDHSGTLGTRHRTSWLPNDHRTSSKGLPTTTLARTVFDLAGLSSVRRLRAGRPYVAEPRVARALDDAIVKRGLGTGELADVVATLGRRGRPGTVLMRRLVAERGEGYVATESELEDLVRAILARYDIAQPGRQRVLGGELPIGRVDFVYLDARLVIEADGRRHHTALLDADRDRWRDLELTAAGFRVIRVTWQQLVQDPERFVAALSRALRAPSPAELRV
ncbi:MAG: endonuclease domain-containing protein [Actinomycetota bacterium]|nr:endonuclease domain-containing protein [Actinomycetota bacterium]